MSFELPAWLSDPTQSPEPYPSVPVTDELEQRRDTIMHLLGSPRIDAAVVEFHDTVLDHSVEEATEIYGSLPLHLQRMFRSKMLLIVPEKSTLQLDTWPIGNLSLHFKMQIYARLCLTVQRMEAESDIAIASAYERARDIEANAALQVKSYYAAVPMPLLRVYLQENGHDKKMTDLWHALSPWDRSHLTYFGPKMDSVTNGDCQRFLDELRTSIQLKYGIDSYRAIQRDRRLKKLCHLGSLHNDFEYSREHAYREDVSLLFPPSPLEFYRQHYSTVTRSELNKLNRGLYKALQNTGDIERVPEKDRFRLNELYPPNPLEYYKEQYPGMTRNTLQELHPKLYSALQKNGDILHVPFALNEAQVRTDPIGTYLSLPWYVSVDTLKNDYPLLHEHLEKRGLLSYVEELFKTKKVRRLRKEEFRKIFREVWQLAQEILPNRYFEYEYALKLLIRRSVERMDDPLLAAKDFLQFIAQTSQLGHAYIRSDIKKRVEIREVNLQLNLQPNYAYLYEEEDPNYIDILR